MSIFLINILGDRAEWSEAGQREEGYQGFKSSYTPPNMMNIRPCLEKELKIAKKQKIKSEKQPKKKITLPSYKQ